MNNFGKDSKCTRLSKVYFTWCRNRTMQQRRLRVSMEHTHMWVRKLSSDGRRERNDCIL
ncbi:hypothetical protein M378DRAFT_164332 [Amanita muscaria Koide BX008]|uniref:Uncharacterized protein n=1 Tax=Amanita muscaria (strain Koide BX008) TaxID=946122 RepID=A0A0C2SKC2_AMAMK|nr:hypothetical protein M378DRAFT_164332 [Amanita muscaria Koide BX008]